MNSRNTRNVIAALISVLFCTHLPVGAQSVKFVKVVSKRAVRTTELPGEFYPFLSVQLHAKVPSYVEKVLVPTLKPGDIVIYAKYGGTEIKVDGEDLLVLRESDVLAKVQ